MTRTSGGEAREGSGDPHPRLAGYRVTDASAAAGAVLWLAVLGLVATDALALTRVDAFVSLAVLVLVPLGLGLVADSRAVGPAALPYRLAVLGQLPAALAVVAALALPVGTPASIAIGLPWVGVTGAVALVGLAALLDRGPLPLPELAVDAALLYLPVGAVALVLHRADATFHFRPIIVLLTVVHYHYAGFVLPLVAGLLGRDVAGPDGRFGADPAGRVIAGATLVIVVNLALIAVGITFSPLVEVLAVSAFTVAVAAFAVTVLVAVVPFRPDVEGVLLGVAAIAIIATMALALAYGYSAFPATGRVVDIGQMIVYHGTLNAFGFALPALVACRLNE